MTAHGSVLSALAAALLFGASTPFAKQLAGDISPVLLAGLLYLGSGIGMGLAHTSASDASLLLNLEAVLTAVVAWVIFRENADRRIVLGMATDVVSGDLGRTCQAVGRAPSRMLRI